jgi:hypothetical protein
MSDARNAGPERISWLDDESGGLNGEDDSVEGHINHRPLDNGANPPTNVSEVSERKF